MKGDSKDIIENTLVNGLASLSGIVCDGAKPSCAGKIAISLDGAFMGYKQALVNRNTISDIESYINQYSILHETEKYVLENDVNSIVSLLKKKWNYLKFLYVLMIQMHLYCWMLWP